MGMNELGVVATKPWAWQPGGKEKKTVNCCWGLPGVRTKLPPFHGNPSGLVERVARPCQSHLAIQVARVWVPGQEGHRTQSRLRINQGLRDTSGRARCMQNMQPRGQQGRLDRGWDMA